MQEVLEPKIVIIVNTYTFYSVENEKENAFLEFLENANVERLQKK